MNKSAIFFTFFAKKFGHIKKKQYFCRLFRRKWLAEVRSPCEKALAQMAESVDALVSNTSGAIRAGSTPALGTR